MRAIITDLVFALGGSATLAILFKATIVLMLGLGLAAIAVQARASLRHLIFATTFALLIALPLVVTSGPSFAIEVPVDEQAFTMIAAAPAAAISTAAVQLPAAGAAGEPASTGVGLPSLPMLLVGAWFGGAFLLIISMAIDLLKVRNLRRHGLPSQPLTDLTRTLAREGGVRRKVDVLLHEGVPAPFTCGWLRPAVILPAEAANWGTAELRHAIVHELEHVRRGDWPSQIAARAACAFYWFHPMVWMAWRKLCLEAERACDDAVVEKSETSSYAEQLVDLSQRMTAGRSTARLGMAKRSDLATRVSALLDVTQRRGRTGAVAAACSLLVGAFVLFSIGPLTLVAQSVVVQKETKPAVDTRTGDDDDDDDDMPSRGSAKDKALFAAASKGDTGSIAKALSEGANVNAVFSGDGTALIAAARKGRVDAIALLIENRADVNLGSPGDGTPLIVAAENGRIEVVKMLLDHGADINLGIPGDANPLIAAAGAGHEAIVGYLLERGADIHHIEPGDENALIHAAEGGHLNVVKLLVRSGADINARVEAGRDPRRGIKDVRTALSMARRGGHDDVVAYLLSIGAKE
jgi:beta-lactamase regulating signal transducer with metallopeptidase domain